MSEIQPNRNFFGSFSAVPIKSASVSPLASGSEQLCAENFDALATAIAAAVEDELTDDVAHKLVIQTSNIRKSYMVGSERTWVLAGVNFKTAAGECVFLSGPSGSGKSTLLSILGCLLAPDEGEVYICDRRVDRLSQAQRTLVRRDTIGFVFQRFQLIRGLSALDNVALPLTLQGCALEPARQQAASLLCQVGLELHLRTLPSSMSPGQCQRVALARAVITKPRLLLADEPTAALDATSGTEVMELLRNLISESGAAAVVVTHDPRIHKYADRVCVMEGGRLKE